MTRVKRASEIVIALLAVLTMLVSGLVIRLAIAPFDIGGFADPVRSAVRDLAPGMAIDFDTAFIAWDPDDNRFEIQLAEVSLTGTTGSVLAEFPTAAVALSVPSLFMGRVVPSHLEIDGPSLATVWSAPKLTAWAKGGAVAGPQISDSPQAATLVPPTHPQTNPGADLVTVVKSLLGTNTDSPLQSLTIRHADITLLEVESGVIWSLPRSTLVLVEEDGGYTVAAEMRLVTAEGLLDVSFEGNIDAAINDFSASLSFQNLDFAALLKDINLNAIVEGMAFPLSGRFGAEGALSSGIRSVSFDIGAGSGLIDVPALYPMAMPVDSLSLVGNYDISEKLLSVVSVYLSLGEARLSGDGLIALGGEKPDIRFRGALKDLGVREFVRYWPASLDKGARRWISRNMSSGIIRHGDISVNIRPDMWGQVPLPASSITFNFDFEDVTAHFLRPLPPVEDAVGTARLTPERMDMKIRSARLDTITLLPSEIVVDKLTVPASQTISVTARLDSSIPEVLTLLDYEPLGYITRAGMTPQSIQGRAVTRIDLKLPLKPGLDMSEIDVHVDSILDSVVMKNVMQDGDLTDGAFNLTADRFGLQAEGTAKLKGVSLDVDIKQIFRAPEDEYSSTYTASGVMSPEELARFSIPSIGYIEGPTEVAVELKGRGRVLMVGTGSANITKAQLRLPVVEWIKPAGRAAKVDFTLEWRGEALHIDNVLLKSRDMTASGALVVDLAKGGIAYGDIDFSGGGENDLRLVIEREADDILKFNVSGSSFDARSFLEDLFEKGDGQGLDSYRVDVAVDEVLALNGVRFTDLSFSSETIDRIMLSANLVTTLDTGKILELELQPGQPSRHLTASSGDAGRAALALGMFINGKGGDLVAEADLIGPFNDLDMKGVLRIDDFRIVRSSALTKVIEKGSGDKIDEFVDAEGIQFSEFHLPFHLKNSIFDLSRGRANGPSIGFTMQGQIDETFSRVNINGAIVPAYGLNALLGGIPLIGSILTGGEGGGLFAFTYRIEGDVEDPDMSVNPLSALAPGFLRNIFEGPKGTIEPIVVEQQPPENDISAVAAEAIIDPSPAPIDHEPQATDQLGPS